MATRFHLVRHGAYALLDQALGGRASHPLSDEGRLQARRVGEALRGRDIAALVSSPVTRAAETATLIGAELGLAVQLSAGFAEIDFGDWTGQTFEALHDQPAWQAWNRFRSVAAIPGGEAMLDVSARALGALRRLAATFPEGELVIVSHAEIIRAILAHVLGTPLDLMRRIEIGAASISEIVLYEEDAAVLRVNHLP